MKDIKDIRDQIVKFVNERDWGKYQTPRNLATSISIEAAEVLEKFQWKLDDKLTKKEIEELKNELADVFIYLLHLSNKLDIDLLDATYKKIEKNSKKYPVEKAKGKSAKYNRY